MANKIKYSLTTENYSLKKNNVLIGINDVEYGPTDNGVIIPDIDVTSTRTFWWNGVTPPSSGYTIYSVKTDGSSPSINVANNDDQLIFIVNSLNGTNFNSVPDLLEHVSTGLTETIVCDIEYPDIVTDGLLSILDPGFASSYPRKGNILKDLSGKNNNGDFYNSPTYSSINGGVIDFDGLNDYIKLPTNFIPNYLPPITNTWEPFTISIWFKTSVAGGIIFGQQSSANVGLSSGYVPAMYVNTDGKLVTSCFWGGSVSNNTTSSSSVNDGVWHNCTVTVSGTTHTTYLDNVSIGTITKTQIYYSEFYHYFIGSGRNTSWPLASENQYFNGSIGCVLFYEKQLSSIEVSNNYNQLLSRY
jgi:hypothetical protein